MKNVCRIYISEPLENNQRLELDKDKTHYLKSVLRKKRGDFVRVFNGKDGECLSEVLEFTKKSCVLKVGRNLRIQPLKQNLRLIFAPLKQARLNFLIEKSVELGVTELIPVLTEHTHVRQFNRERIENIVIEAAEQSERLCIPTVHPLTTLPLFLSNWPKEKIVFMSDERLNSPNLIKQVMDIPLPEFSLLIGPEGGFSSLEFELFSRYKFIYSVSLGQTILRAETAAIAGLAICHIAREAGAS
ncbi:hypothetical protein IM40_04210 [Candidatus Paracaedimonas acanthamoebae]|nr:hypothetical protein IM40_04210 [Candidatus Paracaedimonas acanthamoebae]